MIKLHIARRGFAISRTDVHVHETVMARYYPDTLYTRCGVAFFSQTCSIDVKIAGFGLILYSANVHFITYGGRSGRRFSFRENPPGSFELFNGGIVEFVMDVLAFRIY